MAKTKRRPGTGDKRRTKQPLKIDRLSPETHAIIQFLKNERGLTWQEIEALSAEKYDKDWGDRATWWKAKAGFVDWDELPTRVLELFPEMRLPHSNLHRWYDIRVRQVTEGVLQRSADAQALAAAFAKANVAGDDAGVLNAARDLFMGLLGDNDTGESKMKIARGLIALSEMQQERRLNDIKERQVAANERKLKLLEERERAARERVDRATQQAAKKGTGQFSLDDINLLRERTFGLPPLKVG